MADLGFAKFGDDDDENEEEFEGDYKQSWGQKDGLIFLIDCSQSMFEPAEEDEESSFEICIKCAKTTLQNKIISSDKDVVGIVFYATKKSNSDFKNIYVYQELDQPGAQRILDLEKMLEDGIQTFDEEFGHSKTFSLSEAFWTCSNMFSKSTHKINFKRVMLFTNDDDPHAGNAQLQRQARTKASDLNENGIDLELMHMLKPGQSFDISKFYKDLLFTADDELTDLPDASERLEELMTRVRSKDHKKRAQGRLTFTLGEGLDFSVGVYNLVRTCTKTYPVKLSKKDNEELKGHSKSYLKDTGEVLMPQDMKKAQTYGGRQICFEEDEVKEIKRFDDPGLVLMGFKPRSLLKRHYHVKPAQFLYPDESMISGSTTLFTGLLRKCLDRDVVPICRYIPRKNSPPYFVALLPQEEEQDERKVQLTPPGFHVIFLPFADDFRKIPVEDTPRANETQINKAKDMVKKLQFTFSSESFENPVLQQHWRNIEALALDRDAPEDITDYTEPDVKRMEKRAGKVMEDFSDLVFPDGYVPGAKRGGRSGGGDAAKKAKLEEAQNLDLKKEAQEGRLGKLTVPVLREFIKREKIQASGTRKADLIDAINDHFGV
ncbi:X-ray repair cross-complementing protein 5-like [Liolophura sinensis]|uniref:X-ray repair cross-complementing protein 5-like n=1 Tax=Liolophura sinensis TaxID=3198878 RepID=UPI003157FA47